MHILLHIGQSKTGTSAIQENLTLNRAPLREAGVLYPSVTVGGISLEMYNHNSVADALVGLSRYPNKTADQYFDQFFDEAQRMGANHIILSAEHFFGGEPRIWDVTDEKNYFSNYRAKIKTLAQYLSGHKVTLLVYLRPQVDWLASAISHNIRIEQLITSKNPVYCDDRQFFEMAKPVLQYYRLIDTWANCLSPHEVIVIPYERNLLHKKNIVADFLYRTKLDSFGLTLNSTGLQVNQSLSREYTEVKKILNRTPRGKNEERVVITCLERLSACSASLAPYKLSDKLISEVVGYVSTENKLLNKYYVQDGMQLDAQSETYKTSDKQLLSEVDIASAVVTFEREFSSPRARLLTCDYATRAFLREHAKPLHSLLHQLKHMWQRSNIFTK